MINTFKYHRQHTTVKVLTDCGIRFVTKVTKNKIGTSKDGLVDVKAISRQEPAGRLMSALNGGSPPSAAPRRARKAVSCQTR